MKRAMIILCVSAALAIAALIIPAVKASKFDDFLKGGAVGAAAVGVLMIVVTFLQHPKATTK